RELQWRHNEIVEAGASWDYSEFRPHVTITYDGADVDLAKVEPYQGELIFGPEIFETLDDSWGDDIEEISFAEAAAGDIVDQATAQAMADEGWRPVADELGINELLAELAAGGGEGCNERGRGTSAHPPGADRPDPRALSGQRRGGAADEAEACRGRMAGPVPVP